MTAATLADIPGHVTVWCNRPGCGWHKTLDRAQLVGVLGPSCPVPAVAQHCICEACGSLDVSTRPDWSGCGPGVVARHT